MKPGQRLNGFSILGPKPTETKRDGWRQIVRDERALVKHVTMLQGTLRLAKLIPTWSTLIRTEYYADMRRHLESDMMRKYKAWWEVLLVVGDTDRDEGRKSLGFAWSFLLAEIMHRNHARPRSVDQNKFGLSEDRAEALKEVVRYHYDALTLT